MILIFSCRQVDWKMLTATSFERWRNIKLEINLKIPADKQAMRFLLILPLLEISKSFFWFRNLSVCGAK